MLIAGHHVNRKPSKEKMPTIKHIENALSFIEEACGFKINAVSIFVSQTRKRQLIIAEGDAVGLKKYIQKTGLIVIAHSTYVSPPWGAGISVDSDTSATASTDCQLFVQSELKICQKSGIQGLVVHLPKLPIKNVISQIDNIMSPDIYDTRLYLETPAVVPSETYYETPEKLNALYAELQKKDPEQKKFGICIDTAHLWTNGINVRTFESMNLWLSKLEIPRHVLMFHLNDSAREMGRGPDKHAPLMRGVIWSDITLIKTGLYAVVSFAKANNIPIILERDDDDDLISDYNILSAF